MCIVNVGDFFLGLCLCLSLQNKDDAKSQCKP